MTETVGMQVRPLTMADRSWTVRLLVEHFASTRVVRLGAEVDATELAGLVCEHEGRPAGLLTYSIEGSPGGSTDSRALEVVTIDAVSRFHGAGTALIEAVRGVAARAGCERVWLITTNDNVDAIRFYQRRGFRLVALHRGAADRAREIKPLIPLRGAYGIPMHDELELELDPRIEAQLPAGGP